ncbi:hypothetical protein VOM14_18990 [Paraburkholderia sp. MPAMCS5]|uniref:hypothetical protein n=1 Tax=Paraburkholderia sp. MPAMCS5 TaxID=3112563 RepID=UPI002E18978E|nr:hypothetical protein [Paraburkholderia sp. MPAMCS5]
MLLVTVELLPQGFDEGRKTLAEARIINVGGDAAYGSYLIELMESDKTIASGQLADYPRFATTVLDLVARGIATALSGTEALPPRPVHSWRESGA